MMRRLRAAVLALAAACTPAAAQQAEDAVSFRIPVLPEIARHLDLLEAPAHLGLALENNGLSPSLSSRLRVLSRESAQIRAGILTYKERRGPLYRYEAGLNLSLGVGEASFTVPVEVDASAVAAGAVTVRIYPPLARLLPQEFIDRVDFKIRSLANVAAQRKMLAYLDRLAGEQRAKGRDREGLLEAIAFEAYNRAPAAAAAGPDAGRAEPLSDQVMLLLTLAIWLAGFPILLLVVRMRRKGQRPA